MNCAKCCAAVWRILNRKHALVTCCKCDTKHVVTDYLGNCDLGGGYYISVEDLGV